MSCNSKTASLPVNYVSWFPSELRGKAVPSTESPYLSQLLERGIEHCPLVTWQGLGQSEAFPPFSAGQPQPIRDFPTIEPCMLQCHNTKSYKKRCACTSGSSLEVSQLVYTSGLSQSVALRLILHCSSQKRRLPLRFSSRFKQ